MKGLEYSRLFYEQYGKDMIHSTFSEYESSIAVGLCGAGSDCLGFDDDVSLDHDMSVGFMMWLSDEDYEKIGFSLATAYDRLPREFMGRKTEHSARQGGRTGVFTISSYLQKYTGLTHLPQNNIQWLNIPSWALSQAAAGEIFRDDAGVFTDIRNTLKSCMPEDVRLKKLSAALAVMAQSGQYNYKRCLLHGEKGASVLALSEFAKAASEAVFLLNREHMPYYKWCFRAMKNLPFLSEVSSMLSSLLCENDGREELIEEISIMVAHELIRQELCVPKGDFLEPYAYMVQVKIKDEKLRSMHVMEGI